MSVGLPAVILVGGEGTRLRPLTARTRKDMLPLVDRPLLAYTFEHLARHGVRRAIVSCGYLPTQIQDHFGARYGDLELEYVVEEEPLGTGGAIGFAARQLDGPFLALNGDSLRQADLGALVERHRQTGAKATILLTPVADPSRYGLVRLATDGRVIRFVEKPQAHEIDTNLINAGFYVLEPSVLDLIPVDRQVSVEREVFPQLCEEGSVYGVALPGYWLDVGTPGAYLQAHRDVLERTFQTGVGELLGSAYRFVHETATIESGARLVPPVFVGAGAIVREGARVGSLATIGPGARIGAGCVIENAVVGAGADIGQRASVVGAIVGEQTSVGEGCRLSDLAVVGPGADVGADNTLECGARVNAECHIPPGALTFR